MSTSYNMLSVLINAMRSIEHSCSPSRVFNAVRSISIHVARREFFFLSSSSSSDSFLDIRNSGSCFVAS